MKLPIWPFNFDPKFKHEPWMQYQRKCLARIFNLHRFKLLLGIVVKSQDVLRWLPLDALVFLAAPS